MRSSCVIFRVLKLKEQQQPYIFSFSLISTFLQTAANDNRQKDRRACGILEHHLSILDLQGDEVMLLVEATIVEEKPIVLQGGEAVQAEEQPVVL